MAASPKRKAGDKPKRKPPNRLTEYVVLSVLADDRPSMDRYAELLSEQKGVPVAIGRAVGIAVREALARLEAKR